MKVAEKKECLAHGISLDLTETERKILKGFFQNCPAEDAETQKLFESMFYALESKEEERKRLKAKTDGELYD